MTAPDISAFVDADTRRAAARALEKKRAGKKPTIEESRALRRFEKAAEKQKRAEHYATCPKKDFEEMTGRQAKQINAFADRWGAPLRGPKVDFGAAFTWVFDFFAANTHRLAAAMSGPGDPSDRYMSAKAAREEIRLEQDRDNLMPKELLRTMFGVMAAKNRRFGLRLEKQYGPAARAEYEAYLDDLKDTADRYLDRQSQRTDDPE